MSHDIFISYSMADKRVADEACRTLEANGLQCWIAPRDVPPGTTWADAIVDAINKSRVMLLVFSSQANKSQQVLREIDCAVTANVTILTFRIEDVPPLRALRYYLGTPQWLDAFLPPLEPHLQRLVTSVEALLATSTRESAVRSVTTDSGAVLTGGVANPVLPGLGESAQNRPATRRNWWRTAPPYVGVMATALFLIAWNFGWLRDSGPQLAEQNSTDPKSNPPGAEQLSQLLGQGPGGSAGRAAPRLGLDLLKWIPDQETFTVLNDGDALRSGKDQYVIAVRPGTAGYLYVFQVDSGNQLTWFFPKNDDHFSLGTNPIVGNSPLIIPEASKRTGFDLDATKGKETVFAVLCTDRWPELEAALGAADASKRLVRLSAHSRGVKSEHPLAAAPQVVWSDKAIQLGNQEMQANGPYLQVARWFNHK